jgi:phosphoglycerate dehydrogenase-like enzyme
MNVLLSNGAFFSAECAKARAMLADNGWEILHRPSEQAMREECERNADGIHAVISSGEPWDRSAMAKCKNLKIISRFGVGCEKIDLAAARELGIDVANTPVRALSDSVAELALGLMLSSLRGIHGHHGKLRGLPFQPGPATLLTHKTIGLLGFGAIARALAKMLQGFDARMLAYDTRPDTRAASQLGVTFADFETVLRNSDIVSLHIPALPETHHLMDDRAFGLMKRTALFVNTSRGGLVDEAALHRALTGGKIARAACDVFEREPPTPDNPLMALDNFLGVPHIAGSTTEGAVEMSILAVQNILDTHAGKKPATLLTP